MTTLYDLSVATYLRVLDATIANLRKARAYYAEHGVDENRIFDARLADDMWAFANQVDSVRHHSLNAAKGLLQGEFRPPTGFDATDFEGLLQLLINARAELAVITPEQIQTRVGGEMYFRMNTLELPFTCENFVMSFSLPNLYFHATTVYNLLRADGVPLGKRDFLGKMAIGLAD